MPIDIADIGLRQGGWFGHPSGMALFRRRPDPYEVRRVVSQVGRRERRLGWVRRLPPADLDRLVAEIEKDLETNPTRDTIVNAAGHFGPFDTGFGNTVTWNTTVPREPWNCGYPVVVQGDKWVFDTQKYCV